MADLYIICAGVGSRMSIDIPKALVKITDQPCLTTTLQQIGSKFDNVFVVTNRDVQGQWIHYYNDLSIMYPELCTNLYDVPIKSGYGDGNAVMEGLSRVKSLCYVPRQPVLSDDIVIVWGDVFFHKAEIIDEILNKSMGDKSGLIPCVSEENPYVTLHTNGHGACISADFSKHGEINKHGWHDQSLFRFNRTILMDALNQLHLSMWKNDKYVAPSGELSLLHTFHRLFNTYQPAYVYHTAFSTLSFNTPAEVIAIQEQIDTAWKLKNRDNND